MIKRVADIVVETLIENGITHSFSVVGGGAMHLNNAFVLKKDAIKTIYNHHEQACAMAAEGYARLTGRMAAVCVTSGPGGTNAINGVQGAWVDSIPMIVVSGHPRYTTTVEAMGLNLRSRGVQENDIIKMVSGITKYSKMVLNPLDIKMEVQRAIDLAMNGRRGPSWIVVPLDVQGTLVNEEDLTPVEALNDSHDNEEIASKIIQFFSILQSAERPCILTGSGIRSSHCKEAFDEFTRNIRIPIVGGAWQADINSVGDDSYYGLSGCDGPRCGNFILQNSDAILVLGNSMGTVQTGFNVEAFAPNAKILLVDAEKDVSRVKGINFSGHICTDLRSFFDMWNSRNLSLDTPKEWKKYCDRLYNTLPHFEMVESHGEFADNSRIPQLLFWKKFLPEIEVDAIIALGNSNGGTGLLQEGVVTPKQRVLVNYNCGSMGHDIPQSIGAAVAEGRHVYCVTGDGSVMLNLQEFQTIVYNDLPISVIVFNNKGYGAIRNTCSNFFKGTYTGCDEDSGISFPDFEKIAYAFGFDYKRCCNVSELDESVSWIKGRSKAFLEINELIDEINGPGLQSIMDENGVFHTPALHEMTPLLDDIEKYMFNK